MTAFVHQVELKLSESAAPERLSRISSWCADWEIKFEVIDRMPGSETIRIAFDERRLARAFTSHFGGVLVSDDEISDAMAEDAEYEALYQQYAREYEAG
jgi:hypothetical protein